VDDTTINNIFSVTPETFPVLAETIFEFQQENNPVFKEWIQSLPSKTGNNHSQPFTFLPISFFKSHEVITTDFKADVVFESSGTTQTINSKHLVKDATIYYQSFFNAFNLFYGDITEWCIIGLLPSYLERNNSSLVLMVDQLIKASANPDSGFYLHNYQQLNYY
jgi:hypothetical protein